MGLWLIVGRPFERDRLSLSIRSFDRWLILALSGCSYWIVAEGGSCKVRKLAHALSEA